MQEFELHPRLASDTFQVGDFSLCRVLLMNDSRYPWLVLVPRLKGVREIHQLSEKDRYQLMDESCIVSEWMTQKFPIDKMNVAAIGNLVPQLHVHHVGRRQDDPAWPAPVWGHSDPEPYSHEVLQRLLTDIGNGLGLFKKD